ncbi:hypothetical protein LTR08_006575 [Meristemomyces frigidus]|nr:hypothetical protein LTR08_006575 [Meristemomyces frigidus]
MNGTNTTTNGTFNGTSGGFQSTRTPKPFWSGLILPTLYLTILIGSLYTFASLYRKRQLAKTAELEPWFPPHRQRDIYLSLLHLDPAENSEGGDGEKKLSKVPDSILKAALLKRAIEDIQRIVQLRSSKQALQTLLQRGSVGDELWQRFLGAEKDMEEEVKDVVTEANAFAENWGQTIFQSANEINQNLIIKQRTAEIQAQLESEKAWWERKRAGMQSDLMKDLEANENSDNAESEPAAEPLAKKKKGGSSDEDAVLVDADGPAQAQGGSVRKRKGKK